MKKYNLFILLPNISNEQAESVGQQVSELVKKVGGQVEKLEKYGKRKLSYAIKKVRHGFYLDFILSLPIEKIESRLLGIKKELKLNSEILRFELSNAEKRGTSSRYPSGPNRGTTRKLKKDKVAEKKESASLVDKKKKERSAFVPTGVRTTADRPKISMEELDRKLDNILESDNI